jgi:hypothetical protein
LEEFLLKKINVDEKHARFDMRIILILRLVSDAHMMGRTKMASLIDAKNASAFSSSGDAKKWLECASLTNELIAVDRVQPSTNSNSARH